MLVRLMVVMLGLCGTAAMAGAGTTGCAEVARAPYQPFPLQLHHEPQEVVLEWNDPFNPAGSKVDHYLVLKARLDRGETEGRPIAIVPPNEGMFRDQEPGPSSVYWVRAHNCMGYSPDSNAAWTQFPSCADWDLNLGHLPPLNQVWVETACTGPVPCRVLVTLVPPDVDRRGCPI